MASSLPEPLKLTPTKRSVAAFIFPKSVGHVNPSLALARQLAKHRWKVHYINDEVHREAVEQAGATFHDFSSAVEESLLQETGSSFRRLQKELRSYAVTRGMPYWWTRYVIGYYALEMCFLPLLVDWLKDLKPDLVVYCPQEFVCGYWAAQHLGIRSVSLSIVAGPGAVEECKSQALSQLGIGWEKAAQACEESPWNRRALSQLELYGIRFTRNRWSKPVEFDNYAAENLVTATADFALRGEAFEDFQQAHKRFVFVGPLLDAPGMRRCSGQQPDGLGAPDVCELSPQPFLHRLRSAVQQELPLRIAVRAKQASRRIVYVSMGSGLTSDRWWRRGLHASCRRGPSLTGMQLCKAVYEAVFDALGDYEAMDEVDSVAAAWALPNSPPLIVVDVGPQPDALAGLSVPGNALCRTSVPQAALLQLRPDLFVTHGGQQSFMESMQAGVPVVLCPATKENPFIADMAAASGVGIKVSYPEAGGGGELAALAAYSAAVRKAALEVLGLRSYGTRALEVSKKMKQTGGVETAVRVLCKRELCG